jgi:hypothetical protein
LKKTAAIILLLFTYAHLFAERTNAPTEVFTEPGKEIYAHLNPGVEIYVVENKNGWTKIVAVAVASKTGYDAYTLVLPKKTILYNHNKQEIGKLYGKTKLPGKYFYHNDSVYFDLEGYIRTTEVDTNWVPEIVFANLIDSAKNKIGYDELLPTLNRFGFFLSFDSSNFTSYTLNECIGVHYKDPHLRLKLVFFERRLICLYLTRPFALKNKEVIIISGSVNKIFLRDLNPSEKKLFSQLFEDGY